MQRIYLDGIEEIFILESFKKIFHLNSRYSKNRQSLKNLPNSLLII